jgi:hypothetical protein
MGAILPGAFPGAGPVSADALPVSYLFLNSEESAFVEAAVARLIPADDQWGAQSKPAFPASLTSNSRARGALESASIAAVSGSRARRAKDTSCPSRQRNCSAPRSTRSTSRLGGGQTARDEGAGVHACTIGPRACRDLFLIASNAQ